MTFVGIIDCDIIARNATVICSMKPMMNIAVLAPEVFSMKFARRISVPIVDVSLIGQDFWRITTNDQYKTEALNGCTKLNLI